jgi:CBS domain containing-hemolysin-like protein
MIMSDQIVLLIILIFFSGFFSSAETALFSISRAKARHMAKQGGKINQLILKMKDEPHRLLTTILIGNNVVNVGASALATAITIEIVASNAVGIATGIMTFLILIFGEIFPKSIAMRNNVLIAKLAILPIYWFSVIFYPFILVLNFIPKLTGKIKRKPHATEEELMTFVEVVEEQGQIKEEEKILIHNIFELDDTNTSEIMTPRADMFVIDVNEELDLKSIVNSGFSRIPVIEDDIDHVIGILNIKDLFMHQTTSDKPPDIRKIMRPPYFVPETKTVDTLVQLFKKRQHHLAVVVDEHGGVAGLITLEDVLEELVGEITDETDTFEPHIVKKKNNEWVVLGKSDIDEVNAKISMSIPESKEYDTFSGYVLDYIGRIPEENETLEIRGFSVTVKQKKGNRISKYLVTKR